MGGTVLDMFTLGATPFSLSLFFSKGRGRYNPGPSVLPTSASFTFQFLFSPLALASYFLSLLPFFLSFFFSLFPRVKSKAARKYSRRSTTDQLCWPKRRRRETFRVLIKHGASNGWCFQLEELETRHPSGRSINGGPKVRVKHEKCSTFLGFLYLRARWLATR